MQLLVETLDANEICAKAGRRGKFRSLQLGAQQFPVGKHLERWRRTDGEEH
jgi:hypothetical protein